MATLPTLRAQAQVRRATTVEASQRPPARRVLASMPCGAPGVAQGPAEHGVAAVVDGGERRGADPRVLGAAPAARPRRPAR